MRKKVGQVVQLSVWRAGRTITIPVTTGETPTALTKVSTVVWPKAVPNAEMLGIKLKAVEGRVIVTELAPDGIAAKAGLRVEDEITDVESRAMGSPVAVFEAIGAGIAKDGAKGVLLNVERKGKRTFVRLESPTGDTTVSNRTGAQVLLAAPSCKGRPTRPGGIRHPSRSGVR